MHMMVRAAEAYLAVSVGLRKSDIPTRGRLQV